MTDITQNIRKFRRQSGLSQNDLAERLHVTRQTVSNWETGKNFPDLDMVVQLSEVLRTDPNTLLYPPSQSKGNRYRSVSFKAVPAALLFFFLALTFGAGIWHPLFSAIIGGGIKESFLYPIYAGIILLAGLVVLCTCVILAPSATRPTIIPRKMKNHNRNSAPRKNSPWCAFFFLLRPPGAAGRRSGGFPSTWPGS